MINSQKSEESFISKPDSRLIRNCKGIVGACGTEAACEEGPNSTSKCVCPHDKSEPTADLKCPNRIVGTFNI